MARLDPHSYNDDTQVATESLALSARVDFATRTLHAEATLRFKRPGEGQLVSRFVDFGGLATTDAVPLFILAPEMTVISLKQGQSVQIKVKVTRKPGDNNANPAIALTLPGLSGNINADLPGIPEKGVEVTIKILVAADTPVGKYSAVLTGKLGNDIQVAPAFAINVSPK